MSANEVIVPEGFLTPLKPIAVKRKQVKGKRGPSEYQSSPELEDFMYEAGKHKLSVKIICIFCDITFETYKRLTEREPELNESYDRGRAERHVLLSAVYLAGLPNDLNHLRRELAHDDPEGYGDTDTDAGNLVSAQLEKMAVIEAEFEEIEGGDDDGRRIRRKNNF